MVSGDVHGYRRSLASRTRTPAMRPSARRAGDPAGPQQGAVASASRHTRWTPAGRRWTPRPSGSAPCSAPVCSWSSPRPPRRPGRCCPWRVALAGVVAYCNAVASAQLAARYPASGGTYIYGRKQLGEWPGFMAGWGFVTGKSASCAAMALTFGHLSWPPAYATAAAVAAVVVLTGVNLLGITRTAC